MGGAPARPPFRERLRRERETLELVVRGSLRLDPEYDALPPAEREAAIDRIMEGSYRRSWFGRIVRGPAFALLFAAGMSRALLQGFLDGRAEARQAARANPT